MTQTLPPSHPIEAGTIVFHVANGVRGGVLHTYSARGRWIATVQWFQDGHVTTHDTAYLMVDEVVPA